METVECLLEKHKAIIIYMANRYRYLDEFGDLVSWGYIGFLNAYKEFKSTEYEDVEFSTLIFQHIKRKYIKEYFEKSREMSKRNISIDKPVVGKGGFEGDNLHNFLVNDSFRYSEKDIHRMVDESLFECTLQEKKLIMQYYLNDVEMNDIVKDSGLTTAEVRRITRRGYHLIKRYLFNNNLISEWAMTSDTYEFKKQKPIKALTPEQCRQLKYIRQEYTVLTRQDYANILDCDLCSIDYTLDYPTNKYIRYGLDDSIKEKAESYIDEHYPHLLPSEVEELVMV